MTDKNKHESTAKFPALLPERPAPAVHMDMLWFALSLVALLAIGGLALQFFPGILRGQPAGLPANTTPTSVPTETATIPSTSINATLTPTVLPTITQVVPTATPTLPQEPKIGFGIGTKYPGMNVTYVGNLEPVALVLYTDSTNPIETQLEQNPLEAGKLYAEEKLVNKTCPLPDTSESETLTTISVNATATIYFCPSPDLKAFSVQKVTIRARSNAENVQAATEIEVRRDTIQTAFSQDTLTADDVNKCLAVGADAMPLRLTIYSPYDSKALYSLPIHIDNAPEDKLVDENGTKIPLSAFSAHAGDSKLLCFRPEKLNPLPLLSISVPSWLGKLATPVGIFPVYLNTNAGVNTYDTAGGANSTVKIAVKTPVLLIERTTTAKDQQIYYKFRFVGDVVNTKWIWAAALKLDGAKVVGKPELLPNTNQ